MYKKILLGGIAICGMLFVSNGVDASPMNNLNNLSLANQPTPNKSEETITDNKNQKDEGVYYVPYSPFSLCSPPFFLQSFLDGDSCIWIAKQTEETVSNSNKDLKKEKLLQKCIANLTLEGITPNNDELSKNNICKFADNIIKLKQYLGNEPYQYCNNDIKYLAKNNTIRSCSEDLFIMKGQDLLTTAIQAKTGMSGYVKFDGKDMEIYIWDANKQKGATYYKGAVNDNTLTWSIKGKSNVPLPNMPVLKKDQTIKDVQNEIKAVEAECTQFWNNVRNLLWYSFGGPVNISCSKSQICNNPQKPSYLRNLGKHIKECGKALIGWY